MMLKKITGCFILCVCLFWQASSQSVPRLKALADTLYEASQYAEAIKFYDKIISIDKKAYESQFKLGMSYYRTLQYDDAKKQFNKIIKANVGDYIHRSTYYLGNIYKLSSQFEEADSIFSHLITQPNVNNTLLNLTRKQKEGCLLALRQKANNRGFAIEELEDVNSKFHDFGATVNRLEQTVVFVTTRNLTKKQYAALQYEGLLPDLIQYEQRNDKWRSASSKTDFNKLNSQWSEGSGTFTKDGKSFYFTSCRSNNGGDCKIMKSSLEDGRWSEPIALNEFINLPGSENKQPSITQNGDTLFFSSDRPGGLGGSDIWMSLKGLKENSWTPAINMGDAINTPSNEITPYYSSAFECLIFASDGHVGYGGYDLFAAKGESFFEPQLYNLGDPFNSPLDDTYFNITDSLGFIASNRKNRKNLNLYSFHVKDERLYISLLISGESLIDERVIARFRDIRTLDLTTFRVEDYQGFEIFDPVKRKKPKPKLLANNPFEKPDETESEIIASTESEPDLNPEVQPESITFSSAIESPIDYRDYEITDQGIQYEKVYFHFGKAILTHQARESLNSLIKLYEKEGDKIQSINVLASTDDIGTSSFNLELSESRSDIVKKYLVVYGVPESKINTVSLGEQAIPTTDTTWYGRLLNRRAGIYLKADNSIQLNSRKLLVARDEMTIEQAAQYLNISLADFKKWNGRSFLIIKKGQVIRVDQKLNNIPNQYFIDESKIIEGLLLAN